MNFKNSTKKIIISICFIFIIAILQSLIVNATYFDIDITPINSQIYPDEYAEFNLTITNNLQSKETFTISTNSRWLLTKSEQFNNLEINESRTSIIKLKPRTIMSLGEGYSIPLIIEGVTSDTKISKDISIFLKSYSSEFGEYIPSLNLYTEFSEKVDPREKFKISLRLRNRNPLNITEMDLIVHSDIFHKIIKDSLLPLQEKIIQVSFEIDKDLLPDEHQLDIYLNINNKTYASLRDNFEIISFADIKISEEKDREFLRIITKLNAINNGNSVGTKTVAIEKNWLERIFTTTNVDYDIGTSDGKVVISWTLELQPDEEVKIIISNNYRLLFAIIIIIILVIYLYFNLRSEIVIQKRASVIQGHVHKKEEGNSLLKLKLFIRNRTSKKLHDVEVKERLSKLTKFIEEPDAIGSPNPSKIIHGKSSTLVKWRFEALEPYEERLITYKIESRFKLVGSIQFPRAIVKFRTHEGKMHTTGSNKAMLNFVVKRK